MLRAEFDHTLREAQVGNDEAFVRMWRDANPMLIRYLRVAGASDPRESARHAWAGVIRDLSSFSGDEIAWRAWVLGVARARVPGDTALRGRGARTSRPSRAAGHRGGDGLSATTQVESAELRGINDTIAAIRDLPLGQGEILMLRLMGELPVARVADLVGTDVIAVRRSEDGAVERLGAERELLAWSLGAPALPEELADQRTALTMFRGRRASSPTAPARMPAVLRAPHTGHPSAGRAHAGHPTTGHPSTGRRQTGTPPTVVPSRLAMLCIAAISASAMSAGALSAAAYEGVLPPVLQQVMHNAIGAPAATVPAHPGHSASGSSTSGASAPTTGAGPGHPQTSQRGHGAGTPAPRGIATPQTPPAKTPAIKTPALKTPALKTPALKTPTAKTPTAKASSGRSAPANSSTAGPRLTSSLSRIVPSAKPTAGVTPPAKGQSSSAHPANPTVSLRVSPAILHAVGQASVHGATGSTRP